MIRKAFEDCYRIVTKRAEKYYIYIYIYFCRVVLSLPKKGRNVPVGQEALSNRLLSPIHSSPFQKVKLEVAL